MFVQNHYRKTDFRNIIREEHQVAKFLFVLFTYVQNILNSYDKKKKITINVIYGNTFYLKYFITSDTKRYIINIILYLFLV